MIRFSWHSFHSLTTEELYTILTFRSEVFVTEQKIIYTDPDGKDKCALHLFGMEGNDLVAYLRLFPPKSIHAPVTFGRVATAKTVRGKGYGKQLIAEMLGYCKRNFLGNPVECSAQNYLRKFYESFGFEAIGEIYDEEGIPHIAMISYPT